MRPKRWGLVVGTLVLAVTLIGVRQLDAPIILYPASASLPKGFYLRTFGAVEIGKIAAFPVPEAARRGAFRPNVVIGCPKVFCS